MKKLILIAFVFLFSALFFSSCGKDADFEIKKSGVTIQGKLKDGTSLTAEAAKAKAESALLLSQP
jgi:hypothetical protein